MGTIPLIISSSVPEELRENVQNLVVGLNMGGTGIFMTASNLVMGYIKDKASYEWCCVYLVGLNIFGVVCVAISLCVHKPVVASRASLVPDKTERGNVDL